MLVLYIRYQIEDRNASVDTRVNASVDTRVRTWDDVAHLDEVVNGADDDGTAGHTVLEHVDEHVVRTTHVPSHRQDTQRGKDEQPALLLVGFL
jgi:hypothetical protein